MDYGTLLADSWKMIWNHKALIAFGLPSGLVLVEGLLIGLFAPDVWPNLLSGTGSAEDVALSLGIVAAMLVTGAIASVLIQLGVQTGTKVAVQGPAPVRVGPVLAQSIRYLWRVLGTWFAVGAVLLLIFSLTFGCQVVSVFATAGLASLCTLPFTLVGYLLLAIGMDIATGLTGAAIILDDLGVRPAFRRTWDLLRGRTTPVFLVGLMLTAIARVVPGLLSIPNLATSLLADLPATSTGAGTGGTLRVAQALQLGYLPLYIVALAVVDAFVYCGWSLAYLRLSRPPGSVSAA